MSSLFMSNEKQQQLAKRASLRTRSTMYPSAREVLLARLLLQVVDALGEEVVFEPELYNQVKMIAEPLLRTVSRETND